MEGIPPKDVSEWKLRKEAESGISASTISAQANANKKPRISHAVISESDMKIALEKHKALMSGNKNPVAMGMGMVPGQPMFPGFGG